MSKRQVINGGFQDALGNPLDSGYLTFRLNTDASTGTNQVSAGIIVRVELDASGNVRDSVSFWPNDQLSPSGTVYILAAYTSRGQLAWREQFSLPSGMSSFDLNTIVPN